MISMILWVKKFHQRMSLFAVMLAAIIPLYSLSLYRIYLDALLIIHRRTGRISKYNSFFMREGKKYLRVCWTTIIHFFADYRIVLVREDKRMHGICEEGHHTTMIQTYRWCGAPLLIETWIIPFPSQESAALLGEGKEKTSRNHKAHRTLSRTHTQVIEEEALLKYDKLCGRFYAAKQKKNKK